MSDNNEICDATDDSTVPQFFYDGGVLLLLIGLIQCFWGLARVCEHYFCSALRIMCEELKIPDDVAGATFMAIGSSAADLIISVISLFVFKSTIGLGTIIGSEIFNHLAISACCALATRKPLVLKANLFTREVVAYGLTLLVLCWALGNGTFKKRKFTECLSVHWYHGFVMLLLYCGYATFTVYYDSLYRLYLSHYHPDYLVKLIREKNEGTPRDLELPMTDETSNPINEVADSSGEIVESEAGEGIGNDVMKKLDTRELALKLASPPRESLSLRQRTELFVTYVTYPMHLLIYYTVPDPSLPKNRHLYWVTCLMSIAWMGGLAEELLYCLSVLGNMIGLHPTLMGITISACGASMPTLWSSVVVARKGYADMAISNAMGANVFSVLVGLGLPWFMYPLYIDGVYYIEDDGIIPLILLLLSSLISYWLLVHTYDYHMHEWMGWVFLLSYILIVLLCVFYFFT
jgi:K+-dependent Na+/Ca+ exchanger-like protein